MSTDEYDLVVIGAGPAGEGAAMQAVKAGKSVAVVEKYKEVGGGCTHWGTIPSKSLRHVVWQLRDFNNSPFCPEGVLHQPSYPEMLRAAYNVIRQQVQMREGFYTRNRVPVIYGTARFMDPHVLQVDTPHGIPKMIRAEHVIIATGSRPYRPDYVDFDHPNIYDADTILKMDRTPHSISIYGAGVIGTEYASVFRGLGIKLNLINTRSRLLEFLDDEISDALAYHLRDQGALIRHNEEVESVEGTKDGVTMSMKSGKVFKTEILLWAMGRTGNTDQLDLEKAGLEANHRGQVDVDENYQTNVPHIYAVGDVTGPPALASAAYSEGRVAAMHIAQEITDNPLVRDVPTGIYTSPEISSVGRTEEELTADRISYEVGHAFFKSLARAQIAGQTVGMLKILFNPETLEILGIHCFGDQASEIIHIGQAVMAQDGKANSLMYFINSTFNYPTMAEAYRVAALNGLNRVTAAGW